jgi:RimJ/RimL family protein N-acetyltransferase
MRTVESTGGNGEVATDTLHLDNEQNAAKELPIARLHGRYCDLRQLSPADYDWLYGVFMQEDNFMGFRFGGLPPSPDRFGSLVWQGVSCQFVVTREGHSLDRLGLVTFYGQMDRSQVASLALIFDSKASRHAWVWEGVVLAIDHFFRVTQVRKLCLEIPEWNLQRFRGIEAVGARHEGCLREQEFVDGRFWDRHLFALFRSDWEQARVTLLRRFGV